MPFRQLRYRIAASVFAGTLSIMIGGSAASLDFSDLGTNDPAPIARADRFVAAQAFSIGGRIGNHAISAVGFNFETYFYPVVETGMTDIATEAWTLGRSADDATLIAMIGGEDRIAVSLSTIHHLISHGTSHVDRQSNFAYARSPVDGRLWAVHWTSNAAGEWVIGAVFVPHPDLDWPAGARLFAPRIGGEELRAERCSARARLVCLARP
jgi:hypothetical protein